jgi:hypothetical protein
MVDPISIGLAAGGLLGSMFTSTPEWKNVNFQGVDAGRYGFQGAYQQFLEGEKQKQMDDSQRRIMKLASGLVPGQASFRGGLASQGLSGATSNVMAEQQRNQTMGKALDTGLQTAEQGFGRINEQFNTMTGQNEGMYNQATQFNAQGQFNADLANSQGQFGADKAQSDKWQGIFGQFANAGFGMMGQQMGMQNYKDMFNDPYAMQNWSKNLENGPGFGQPVNNNNSRPRNPYDPYYG